MARRDLIHPRLLERLPNFYPHTITIQEQRTDRDAHGQRPPRTGADTWQDLAGHQALSCAIGVKGGGQRRDKEQVVTQTTQRIALRDHYPAILIGMRGVASDGITYSIVNVQHDTQALATYLDVEVVS